MGEGNLKLLSPVLLQWLENLEETTELRKDSESAKIQSVTLDLPIFYKACNPSQPVKNQQYYIDFSSVRSSDIIKTFKHHIAVISPDKPTCQLFTGHIGCGKSTELLRLKSDLEQEGFHVVYFESSYDIDMADVDVTDILLSIAGKVSESVESNNIRLHPGFFANLFTEIAGFLQIPIGFSTEAELSINIGKITTKTKESPKLRRRLRQYLEPRTSLILHSINQELLGKANTALKQRGKAGLVLLVDNLDRVDFRPLPSGRSQQEYLFIDRGDQLRKLNCHVVYTIPLELTFSNDCEILKDRLGGGIPPKVLPMVPVKRQNGEEHTEGMELLRQMVMVRAFPDESLEKLPELILEVFDTPETLDRLCSISGGHLRNLLGLLLGCVMQDDPPFSREALEVAIRDRRYYLLSSIDDDEWELLFQVMKKQTLRDDIEHNILMRSMFVFEYRDLHGQWFDINPILAESRKFQSLSRK
ncbi:MAG: ATP-binding protein [Symploca sp. SIO1C2]|nr:ATP-binding protein [Symploca sp. SIO1C2]